MAEPEEEDGVAEPDAVAEEEQREPEEPAADNDDAATADEAPADAETAEPPPQKQSAAAQNINFAQFFQNAQGGVFGVGAPQEPGHRRATGRLDPSEIEAALEHYVRPPCFEEAFAALARDAVVVLTAPVGSGKRSGAIALLAELVEGAGYVVLSPDSTLDQLAERTFKRGYGYVLLDRLGEDAAGLADFKWRRLRGRVREHKAHLVVTTVHDAGRVPLESVRHVVWRQPTHADVLRLRLRKHRCDEAVIDEAVERMPHGCSLAELVVAADRIGAGGVPHEVWSDHGTGASGIVRDWFADERTLQQIAEVTTLAFAVGSRYRVFESLQADLELYLAEAFPEPPEQKEPDTSEEHADAPENPTPWLAIDRRRSLKANPLVAEEAVTQGPITRTVVTFTDPRHHQWVLEELWSHYSTDYWDAVRDWLAATVATAPELPLQYAIALGLALLSGPAFDEVYESYLEPWASGEAGPVGMTVAVLTLWCMCLEESQAAAALLVARRWILSPDPLRQVTAVTAFGGMLGVRFPTDAVKRLWQKIAEGGQVGLEARENMAGLFAALTESGEDAGVVVDALKHRMRMVHETTKANDVKVATFDTVLRLLSLTDIQTGRYVCAVAMEQQPELMADLAELMVGTLRHRPRRADALHVLLKILQALPGASTEPTAAAMRFGEAVGAAVPPSKRTELVVAFLQDSADRLGETDTAELIGVFRDAVLNSKDPEQND